MTITPEMLAADQEMSVLPHNSCGECQACCVSHGVREIGKPYSCECQHQTDKGCAIYTERPVSCRTFGCLYWVRLLNDASLRPDKLGVMMTFTFSDGGLWLDAYETRPDALEGEEQQEAVNRACEIVQQMSDDISGLRIFPYGALVGVDFKTNDAVYPYEEQDPRGLLLRRDGNVLYFVGKRRRSMKPLPMVRAS